MEAIAISHDEELFDKVVREGSDDMGDLKLILKGEDVCITFTCISPIFDEVVTARAAIKLHLLSFAVESLVAIKEHMT